MSLKVNIILADEMLDINSQTVFNTYAPHCDVNPTFNEDLCNKLYVDTISSGATGLLGTTNTWTGTNTFNNTISASKINVTTPASAYELLENLTGNLNIANNQWQVL